MDSTSNILLQWGPGMEDNITVTFSNDEAWNVLNTLSSAVVIIEEKGDELVAAIILRSAANKLVDAIREVGE